MAPHCLVILPINEKGSWRCLEIELFVATVLTLRPGRVRFSLAKKKSFVRIIRMILSFQQRLHSVENYACIIPRRVKKKNS